MIDKIIYGIGLTFIISILILLISICWYFIIRNLSQGHVEIKALCYAIISNMKGYKLNKSLTSKIDMRVGRKWFIKYKNKWYEWECIKEEDEE